MIVYFFNDAFDLIYNGKIISIRLKDILSKGTILKKDEFMESFLKTMKKEKIKTKLFGDSITIVQNGTYNNAYQFYLDTIFLELGFIKVNYLDIRKLFLDDQATYVLMNDHNMILYLKDTICLDLNYFKDIPKILDYFKDYYKKYLILFGTNSFIPKIRLNDITVYYLENYNSFISESLLKVKRCDV